MYVLHVGPRRSNIARLELPKEDLVIDHREFNQGIPNNEAEFKCTIDGTNLTIRRIDEDGIEGWNMHLRFRVYDPSIEQVPEFNDECYTYLGELDEEAPKTVKKVIVRDDVRVVGKEAFQYCAEMRECLLHDNVLGIKAAAFRECMKMENIRLPRRLEYIEEEAFEYTPLRSVYVPAPVQNIQQSAFLRTKLKILVLPTAIDVNRIGINIIKGCEGIEGGDYPGYDHQGHHIINTRLKHMYDGLPLFRICANPEVTVEEIENYRTINGSVEFSMTDNRHNLTPLHILCGFNVYCDTSHIMTCFNAFQPAVIFRDSENLSPLDYMRQQGKIDSLVNVVKNLVLHSKID